MPVALALLAGLPLVGLAAVPAAPAAAPKGGEAFAGRMQAALDALLAANPSVPGLAVHVEAPRQGISWSGAAGVVARGQAEKLHPEHPVRIASTTKTYTAAAVLRLVEDGALRLDDPIARHLPTDYAALLAADGYRPVEITVRQLLDHTSGIFDYAFGDGSDFSEVALADLRRRWTRKDQVEFAMRSGAPVGKPGERFHYSDTGYLLLGEIVERRSGLPLAQALRRLLGFERLGLRSTWLETLEPAPPGARDRAHQYSGAVDVHAADPSFDLFGGGGLVATVADMARFFEALLGGRVFTKKETLAAMLTLPKVEGSDGYGLGIGHRRLGSAECWGHGGYWGTDAVSCPEAGVAIALTVNQSEGTDTLQKALLETAAREAGLYRR